MYNATANTTGSANQQSNILCIRLWINVTFRGVEILKVWSFLRLLFIYLFVYLFINLIIYLFIYLFIIIINKLFINLSICVLVCFFICFLFCPGCATRLVTCVYRLLFIGFMYILRVWSFIHVFVYLPPPLGLGV